ncbi:MAG: LSU ribosomal protein L23p (L23Ae), partial [uncultured Rubrobacteraceae bacterium]
GSAPGNHPSGHLGEELQPHRDRGTVHVPGRPAGEQEPDQAGRRAGVRREGPQGEHGEHEEQAEAPGPDAGPHRELEESRRPPAGGRAHRAVRGGL